MSYKFEKLEVWHLAVEYTDRIYLLAEGLPKSEEYNLRSQIIRAATSIALNIAEGSTSQSDDEQVRFVGIALRSLIETVACLHIIKRHYGKTDPTLLSQTYQFSEKLFAKLEALRSALKKSTGRVVREEDKPYGLENDLSI